MSFTQCLLCTNNILFPFCLWEVISFQSRPKKITSESKRFQSLAAIFNFSFYYWERWTIFCTFRDCHVDDNFISFFLHKNIFHTFVYIIFCFADLNFQETSSTVVQTYVSLKSVIHVIYRFIKRFSAFV